MSEFPPEIISIETCCCRDEYRTPMLIIVVEHGLASRELLLVNDSVCSLACEFCFFDKCSKYETHLYKAPEKYPGHKYLRCNQCRERYHYDQLLPLGSL